MSTKQQPNDPNYEREAARYKHPVPSREFIMQYLRDRSRPARRAEIMRALGVTEAIECEGLRRRLRAMERDGQLIFTRRGGYGLIEKMNMVRGRIMGHKEGFGFVIPEDGSPDLFLNAYQMRAVFDGDRVLARVGFVDSRGRREGEVVEVLERHTTSLVGRFFAEAGYRFVVPENKRIAQNIIITDEQQTGVANGQYVMVEITTMPTVRNQAIGRIVEVLGDHMAPGMEIDVAIRNYGLPHQWPTVVAAEAARMSEDVSEADKENRTNLCDKAFVTIDGEDAKDYDDAVYCEPRKRGGWLLYVAIADVSHYVNMDSALDQEAFLRGNSVYFPGRVLPMLPEILSNGLCSLKPKTDRLALVCEMAVSAKGKLTRYRFYPAVIHSHARLTYTHVAKMLVEQHTLLRKQHKVIMSDLEHLYDLYKVLRQRRKERGALDFDTTETKVEFGPERKIKRIVPIVRNDAHRLIEECMLLANVSAAKFLFANRLPGLYRVHEGPSQDKLQDLRKFLASLALGLKGGKKPRPKDYAHLLASIENRPDKHLIQTVLLRSLSQAVYTPDNRGHFGLAYDCYTHYTSPIRRYPDLLVHRAIYYQIANKKQNNFYYDQSKMVAMGEHCSSTERRADEATRDVLDWLKCEYMQDHVGEEFDGIITGVTGFGLFIELKDFYVEGLLHVTALQNDYYHFDPAKHRLRGERTDVSYRLADPIRVRVVRVDLDSRNIDFELAIPIQGKGKQEWSKVC